MGRRRAAQRDASRAARNRIIISILIIGGILWPGCPRPLTNSRLPRPIFEDQPEMVDLYWKVWELLDRQISHGNRNNGFPDRYINISREDVIEQWPTLSTLLYAVYGWREFPVAQTLDLFYARQRVDGFIARVYIVNSGESLHAPTQRDPMIHPPLFAWVERRLFQLSGDTTRLRRVFPHLAKYFLWLDTNCRSRGEAGGLYYTTPQGSGMINLPRPELDYGAWVDFSSQMALFARDLAQLARLIGDHARARYYSQKYTEIKARVQTLLWDADSDYYRDLTREGRASEIETIAGFWPLLAEIPSSEIANRLTTHLQDSSEFFLPHPFPTVSASEMEYNTRGFYWRGGVWGITNAMIIQGLKQYGQADFARQVARKHLDMMTAVYRDFAADIAVSDVFNGQAAPERTIWELYSPEEAEPGTCWDPHQYCQSDHIAFSGHGPITILIEDILGFTPDGPRDRLTWRIDQPGRHGIENLSFGDNRVSIWTEDRFREDSLTVIHGKTNSAVRVCFQLGDEEHRLSFDAGPLEVCFIPRDYIENQRRFP